MYTTSLVSILLGTALALPSAISKPTYNACQSGKYKVLQQIARVSLLPLFHKIQDALTDTKSQFDNDPNGVPATAAASINLYLDIFWNGMGLDMTAGSQNIGIVPRSPPNTAAFAVGDPATLEQGQPAMTTVYADSTIFAFDLHSFFFGLVTGLEASFVGVPVSGSLTVTGIDTTGRTVGTQTFEFVAQGLQQQMIQAVLGPEFSCLRQAVFQINGPAGGLTSATGNATIAASTDDYQYTVYGYDV